MYVYILYIYYIYIHCSHLLFLHRVVELFDGRPCGIFHLLQEECSLGTGSDLALLNKLRTHHKGNPLFRVPRYI